MKTDEVIEKIKSEIERGRRIYGVANARRSIEEWICLVTKQVGDAVVALSSGSSSWVAEELIQIAAVAIMALERIEVGDGAGGIVRMDRIDTPYPRIAGKTAAPPASAVLVGEVPEGAEVYVGEGKVWVCVAKG